MKSEFKNLLIILFTLLIQFVACISFGQSAITKKLIEFGWDYPSVSYLRTNIDEVKKTSFDGVCFSFDVDIYNAFDTTQFADSKFQYDPLSTIDWGKLTENFVVIRGTGYSGAHWLDDASWQKISQNLRKVSKALSGSKIKGIVFDPEYYFKDNRLDPWVYNASYYNGMSYQEVGNYVRRRGKVFIQSLQSYKPDVKVLCLWLLGLVYAQNRNYPIEKTGMALLPFFVEGMLEGKNNSSEIIDGNESSYWYQKPENFIESGEYIRNVEGELIQKPLRYKYRDISTAQSVYFDGIYAKNAQFEKGFDKKTKKRWLKNNLYFAYKTTDKYVWFYDEKVNWWKNSIDSGVREIINEVKNKMFAEGNENSSLIQRQSSVPDFKKDEPSNYRGFSYNYHKDMNVIEIELLNNSINDFKIYENSHLFYEAHNPPVNFPIDLQKKFTGKGNLILVSKDSKGITSVAFVN